MTIRLTSPIFVAGAHQPIGTSLTLDVAREAELVNRGVAIYTSRALAPGEGLTPAMMNAAGNALVDPVSGGNYAVSNIDNVAILPPPKRIYALAKNASADIQWRGNHAGNPSSWTVAVSPGGATLTIPATSVNGSATITGLTNGTAYTFTVKATNSAGSSAASLSSNSVTPTGTPTAILPVVRGLEFWWSASQVVSPPVDGGVYATMTDMSGNGYNAAGVGSPTWVTNWSAGKPAVALNGSSQYFHTLASGYYGGARGINNTIYVVYDVAANANAAGATGGRVLSLERPNTLQQDIAGGFAYGVGTTAAQAAASVYNNSAQYGGPTFEGANFGLNTHVYATITKPGGVRVNGVGIAGLIDGTLDWGAGCPWTFGCMYGGGFNKFMQGRIAEIVIFNVVHTAAEIALMETYLATRI